MRGGVAAVLAAAAANNRALKISTYTSLISEPPCNYVQLCQKTVVICVGM